MKKTRVRISPDGTLPPALQRSTPRQVRLSPGGVAALVAAVVCVVAGWGASSALYAKGVSDRQRLETLAREGRTAPATVMSVRRTGGDSPRYLATYRFSAGGREYTGRHRFRRRPAEGSSLTVRYLPRDPAQSWVGGGGPGGPPAWLPVLVGALSPAVALLILLAVRRQQTILAEWRAALARVTRSEKRGSGDEASWRIEYEWKLLSGAVRKGRRDLGKAAPQAGALIPILYDRDNPQRHTLWPLSLVR